MSKNHMTAFDEYRQLLAQLREMIAAGQGDSDAADELRDQMDVPWTQLTAEQLEEIESEGR